MSNPRPVIFLGGASHRRPIGRWCLPPVPPGPSAFRGRLKIGYRITGGRLQGQVDIASRTEATQGLTSLVWSGPLDAVSRWLLAEALRRAVHPDPPARLHVFAAIASELYRHAVVPRAWRPGNRTRHRRVRHGPLNAFAPNADSEAQCRPDDLLAAVDDLSNAADLLPRVTLTDCAAANLMTRAVLPALYSLFADLNTCLGQALQPLEPHIGPDAVRAILLETRRELDELAACHTAGDRYVESLTITAAGDKPMSIAIEGLLGPAL